MKNILPTGNINLLLTAEELEKIQAILRWTKVAVQHTDEEKLLIERILHKIRRIIP
tara:strand:- start:152 stop:319 length:168 start_codon:yes stop_codon:yes gene_type:complete